MKKTAALFLVVILVAALFVACGDNGDDTSAGGTSQAGTSSDSESAGEQYISGLPSDLRYDGETFTILSSYTASISDDMNTFFGGNGEYEPNVVNEAALLRNSVVEDKLGITIVEVVHADSNAGGTGSMQQLVTTSVNSGLVDFDMLQASLYNNGVLTTGGALTDMSTMKHIDFDAEWWNQTFIKDTSFANSVYYAVGDISFGHMNCIYFVLFNKELQSNFELEDFYEYVRTGKWTYDVMFTNSKMVLSDIDNNGTYSYGDMVGSCGQSSVMWASYYASGGRITTEDKDGYPELTFDADQSVSILTKMTDFFKDKDKYLILGDDESKEQLRTNNSLFFCYHTGGIKNLSDIETPLGFLPHPKYTEDQETYYSLISPWGGQAVAVPYGFDDDHLDYVSAVMEEMAVQGKNHLTDAFCETMCKYQKTYDEDSIEMLDTIFQTSGCDLGLIYRFGNYSSTLQLFAENGNTAIVSTIEASKSSAEIAISKYIETILDMRK